MRYFVGDIQGCYQPLQRLLEQVKFDPSQDILHPVGDLIARGPDSLAVAKLVLELGDAVQPVLGNHDLHLIAVYHQLHKAKKGDKLEALLQHSIISDFIEWLRRQPLMLQIDNVVCTHAGWHPALSLPQLANLAQLVQRKLSSVDYVSWLPLMYGNEPKCWTDNLSEVEQFRFATSVLTRMRYLTSDLSLNFTAKMPLADSPNDLQPWFASQTEEMKQYKIVFGHWASLLGETQFSNLYALDTGCVWGNQMTMWCMDNNQLLSATPD